MELSSNGGGVALQRLTMGELRIRYTEVFGEQASSKNRAWILKRLAWRLQALAEGGLSERARRRAGRRRRLSFEPAACIGVESAK